MTKDEAKNLLDNFYDEMKEAELLAYESCQERDARQEFLLNKYAELLEKADE